MTAARFAPEFAAPMAAQELPAAPAGAVPDWIKILPPPGRPIATHDGRGPYVYADAQAVIAASLARKRKLVVDENHATEIAARQGAASPARGYVAEFAARADGIWARIDWTEAGRALMADRAYWGVSPVILLDAPEAREIRAIKSIALTNEPNLRDLPALHHEEERMFQTQLAEALGLPPAAPEADLLARVRAMAEAATAHAALQSHMGEVAAALGVEAGSEPARLAEAARARAGAPGLVAALQSEVAALTTQLAALQIERQRALSTAYIDGEIARGRRIPASLRDHYVARHMQDPATVETEVAAFMVLQPGLTPQPQATGIAVPQTAQAILEAAQAQVAKAAAQGRTLDYLTAVQMVTKG